VSRSRRGEDCEGRADEPHRMHPHHLHARGRQAAGRGGRGGIPLSHGGRPAESLLDKPVDEALAGMADEDRRAEIAELSRLLLEFQPTFIQRGLGPEGCERFWKLRREFSYSLRDTGLTKLNEDVVVPRGSLEALFQLGASLQKKHGIQVACFGHAGDGNIHVNLMLDESVSAQREASDRALDELFQGVVALGGSITGEHGVGLAKKPWWNIAVSSESDALHRRVKAALDPAGILNPGKFLG